MSGLIVVVAVVYGLSLYTLNRVYWKKKANHAKHCNCKPWAKQARSLGGDSYDTVWVCGKTHNRL